jgi:nitrite reductase/ring-hydroxylating ferredoxin subunit
MFVKLCKISEVSEGSLSRFDVQGEELLVTKIGDSYLVVDTWCTHEEADLSLGIISPEGVITCPLHQAHFDLVRSGTVLEGPSGEEPSSIPKLRNYKTRVEDGELWADL